MPRSEQSAVTSLVERLAGWVEQQPEYAFLFQADRARRRRAARIVAYRLFILPTMPPDVNGWNRKTARSVMQGMKKVNGRKLARLKARRAREEAKYQTQFERYARLSVKRMNQMAERGDVLAAAMLEEGDTE